MLESCCCCFHLRTEDEVLLPREEREQSFVTEVFPLVLFVAVLLLISAVASILFGPVVPPLLSFCCLSGDSESDLIFFSPFAEDVFLLSFFPEFGFAPFEVFCLVKVNENKTILEQIININKL